MLARNDRQRLSRTGLALPPLLAGEASHGGAATATGGPQVVALASVYLDESGTHDGAPVMCMGGYLFKDGNADKFNRQMAPVYKRFNVPYFHTAEILGGKHKPGGSGRFDHLSADHRDELARIFIKTVKRLSAFGFGATIDEQMYEKSVRRYGTMPSAYAFLFYQCFIHVRKWIQRNDYRGKVAYFLENGAHKRGDAIDYMTNTILKGEARKQLYGFSSFSLVEKDSCPVAHSPDLIAYHWFRYHKRRLEGHYLPRADLVALLRPQDMVADWASGDVAKLEAAVRDDFALTRPLIFNPQFGSKPPPRQGHD